ncbi:amidohydrolase family protein [Nocardioides mangrovi]|uniref:Amidohydrolase family protein n=1 Tax=Nocardioides mangrovi TaxID=2874580 RepID=A0ABS7UI40_9ACTN|nr:amidohydrolase family protein [Nocardioides mangrovi]MBZ5740656.1 amidohydrolase family protein [Nocardioides mangrovi]
MPISNDRTVAPDESVTFAGQVWIGDDGLVAAVTKGSKAGPPEFAGAPVVDVGSSLVLPGLIDLHNHLAYNTLPLWTEPTQPVPFAHHNSWTGADSYSGSTTWPAYAFITACPEELLAYVEAKAVVGGTTTVQGSPPKSRPRDGWLVRNVEDESFGTGDRNLIYASTLTLNAALLADRANKMRAGSSFIYHCSEGQRGSVVAQEYTAASRAGCLGDRFVGVHVNAIDPAELASWSPTGAIAWSPFSNLWLYGRGSTTDIPTAVANGLTVCLGSDWAPSGTKHVLGEIKAAKLVADDADWDLSEEDLVRMATCNPGDVLARAWHRQIGRLQPGAIADVLVVSTPPRAHAFHRVVTATEEDVELVVIDGRPRYGTPDLMTKAGADPVTPIEVAGRDMELSLTRSDDAGTAWDWQDVVDRLDEVRAHPEDEIREALQGYAAFAGRLEDPAAPLRLALDMPTGVAPVGGLPKDLSLVHVPPVQSLTHDADWLQAVSANPFHGGVLDGLAGFYS